MKKKQYLQSLGIALGVGILIISGYTMSYLTDSDQEDNHLRVGYHESTIEEDFPFPTPIPEGGTVTIPKRVTIKNSQSDANVDCYVRARILYSNSDLGSYVSLPDLDLTNWALHSDGYYYYKGILKPGESTTPLFTHLLVDTRNAPSEAFWYSSDLDVTVYEESIQAEGFDTYERAWQSFLHENWTENRR